jgi:hypothetical protein
MLLLKLDAKKLLKLLEVQTQQLESRLDVALLLVFEAAIKLLRTCQISSQQVMTTTLLSPPPLLPALLHTPQQLLAPAPPQLPLLLLLLKHALLRQIMFWYMQRHR